MNRVKLTKHAIQRAKERFNLKANDLKRIVEESLTEGMSVFADETLANSIHQSYRFAALSGIQIYKGIAFLFVDDILVTVFPASWLVIHSANFGVNDAAA